MENIGARRLHTVMATLMEDLLFQLPEFSDKQVSYDADKVRDRLAAVVEDDDLRRYIL
jgi:ATP-dependent HslUV protease ATP-binding subunit HslU